MTKSKNDMEELFGKLLGSSNSFNTINTFNESAKDIFKNKNFKIEDLSDKLNDTINNIGNVIDSNVKEIKDKFLDKEIKEQSKEHESYEEEKDNKKLAEQIANEIANATKNVVNNLQCNENNEEFNLHNIVKTLNGDKLKEAMVLTEILGKPISKRRRNRGYRKL